MLYHTFSNELMNYFGLFPRCQMEEFNAIIAQMIENNQLKGYLEGEITCGEQIPTCLSQDLMEELTINEMGLIHQKLYPVWCESFRLLVQVIGNSSFKIYQYAPLNDNIIIQQALKNWVKEYQYNIFDQEYLNNWIDELESLLNEHSVVFNNLFLSMLDTKEEVSQTSEQRISQFLELDLVEMKAMEKRIWLQVFSDIYDNQEKYPILYSWHQNQMKYFGLVSRSCRQTEILYYQGRSIEDMVRIRNLKQTTIQDHLMEIAVLSNKEVMSSLLPPHDQKELWQALSDTPTLPYKQFYQELTGEEVSFLSYRLLQIYQLKLQKKVTRDD